MILKELPLIFGIAGVARCGKDTLGKHLISKLNKAGFPAMNISFAMELLVLPGRFASVAKCRVARRRSDGSRVH